MSRMDKKNVETISTVLGSLTGSGGAAVPEVSNEQQDAASMANLLSLLDDAGHSDMVFIRKGVCAFGDWVRLRRLEANLTQEQMAQIAGVSRATVANVESGAQPDGPRIGTAMKLLLACGKKLEWHFSDLPPNESGMLQIRRATTVRGMKGRSIPAGSIGNSEVTEIFGSKESGHARIANRRLHLASGDRDPRPTETRTSKNLVAARR